MKKLFLLLVPLLAVAGTNTISVRVDIPDQQVEELQFLKRYYASTNTIQQFLTNVTDGVMWNEESKKVLAARRFRIAQSLRGVTDSNMMVIESVINLVPLTNSIAKTNAP